MAFQGFPSGARTFLAELAENNDRAWFAENRSAYDRDLLGPEREFVEAMSVAFSAFDPRVHADSAVNRSIFRINRDTRFARDKSPYKTHADMWFWIGDDRKAAAAGYFVRIIPNAVWVGGGAHKLTDGQIVTLRSAIDDEESGSRLAALLADLGAGGYEIGEATLKRVPRGFAPDHPRADLLRFTSVFAMAKVSPSPKELESAKFVDWCMAHFSATRPLVDWLAEEVA